jgi:hypothetical protein
MNKTTKILVGVVIIFVAVWFIIHQLYNYYKKFNERGITPVESALYSVGVVVVLAILSGLAFRGSLFDFVFFSEVADFISNTV